MAKPQRILHRNNGGSVCLHGNGLLAGLHGLGWPHAAPRPGCIPCLDDRHREPTLHPVFSFILTFSRLKSITSQLMGGYGPLIIAA